jgi:hypothetical protein
MARTVPSRMIVRWMGRIRDRLAERRARRLMLRSIEQAVGGS